MRVVTTGINESLIFHIEVDFHYARVQFQTVTTFDRDSRHDGRVATCVYTNAFGLAFRDEIIDFDFEPNEQNAKRLAIEAHEKYSSRRKK